jgi:YVTN family beta-propeller protein
MDFRIMGPLEVLDEERVLDVGGGKQRAVLALLLLHANEVVSSDRLIDELWPSEPPPSAAKIVQAHVSRLRKALDSDGEGILLTRGHGYLLRVEPGELDLDRFQELLDHSREALAAGDTDRAEAAARDGLALWRGPPLAEFLYDPFAQNEIARLEELHLAAIEQRIESDLALGRHADVVQELEQLVRGNPLRERLLGQLMLALYRSGRQAEALEVYRDARRALADELGLEPSPTLQQLERAILTHDEALLAPVRRAKRRTMHRRGGLLVAAGALIVVAAAISVAVIGLTGNHRTAALASLAPDTVGVIDPGTNRIVGQIPVGSAPTRIALDRDGVWAISPQDKTITRIDPSTRTAVRTIPLGGPPIDVAVGTDAVWVLASAHPDPALGIVPARISRIDPSANDVLRTIPLAKGPFGFGAGGSIAAGDGAIWVANAGSTSPVSRIDADANRVTARVGSSAPSGPGPPSLSGGIPGGSGIAVGEEAVWVGTDLGVIRINPRFNAVSATIPLNVGVPTGIAVGEGSVWIVARPFFSCCPVKAVGAGTLTRIDPKGNSVNTTVTLGGSPAGVAVGEGSVWIADAGTRAVVRVDPATNRVVARIEVGAQPRGIALGDGSVWVSVG